MRFSPDLYKRARKHYVARAVEFREIRDRANWEVTFADYSLADRKYREAASMARKIVERGWRERGLFKYAVGKK